MPKITYTDEFKRDAVALVESGISQKQVVKDLGVAKTTLQAWVRDARFQSHGMTPTTDPEARKDMSQALRRIRELEMENPQNDLPARKGDGRRWCPSEGAGRGRVPGLGILHTGLLQMAQTACLRP